MTLIYVYAATTDIRLFLCSNIALASKYLLKATLFSKFLIWLASYYITW